MSYTATKAVIGAGTALKHAATQAGLSSATALLEIIGFTPAKSKVAMVKCNRFDGNVVNGILVEDKMPTTLDPGEWTFKLHYDKYDATGNPNPQVAALKLIQGLNPHFWEVIYPDTKTRTFQGVLTEFGEEVPLEDKMTVDITVAINGGSDATFA